MFHARRLALQYFFTALFPTDRGYVEIRPFDRAGKLVHRKRAFLPAADKARIARYVLAQKKRFHVYFGACTRSDAGRRHRCGTGRYLAALTAFWADLDAKRFGGLREARAALDRFALSPSILAFTGHGYHAYWLLDRAIPLATADRATLQAGLKALQTRVLNGDDVSDLARVMRAPWSYNIKDERPILTKAISITETRYPLQALLNRVPWEDVLHRDFGTGHGIIPERYGGLDRVLESDFIAYCRDHAKTLPEPLWYAMITNLIGFRGGRTAIHTLSRPHPNYTFAETEDKIAHALADAPGPHSYRYIAEHGFRSRDLDNPKLISPASRAVTSDKKR